MEPSKTPASWEDEEEDATWEDIAAEEARKLAEAAAAVPKNPHAGKPLKKKKEKKVAFAEEQRQLTAEEEAEGAHQSPAHPARAPSRNVSRAETA